MLAFCLGYRQLTEELFPARLILPENHGYVPILTPPQISTLLSTFESGIKKPLKGLYIQHLETRRKTHLLCQEKS